VLAMNLPEGFLLDRVMALYRKTMDMDDMNLLALTSTPSAGRVWARLPEAESSAKPSRPLRLKELLSAPGTEGLFEELLERYVLNTALSGVQPKVVVPEAKPMGRSKPKPTALTERSAIHAPDLIVKAAGIEYSGLPECEYLCMSMARAAGLEVPECWLSEDASLFVIRRFDLRADGGYLGFEDAASLTGRQPRDKYNASYADVARAIADFCAPRHRAESLERFFRQLVFCCLIRNGDAHLKNWGVLYGDPSTAAEDARLAPAFDLVGTTVWIKADTLALGLGGTKAWPLRSTLEWFGTNHCSIAYPGKLIDELVERALDYRPPAKTRMWKMLRAEVDAALPTLAKR
jgi:serine/threonine-protein kinase HipA